jgi:hypothetical protein
MEGPLERGLRSRGDRSFDVRHDDIAELRCRELAAN